jgi:hypothetical protein
MDDVAAPATGDVAPSGPTAGSTLLGVMLDDSESVAGRRHRESRRGQTRN